MSQKVHGGVLFFVLKGLYNGVSGERATPPSGVSEEPYEDGWWWMPDHADFPLGPYESRDAAILDVKPLNILGHTLTRISEEDANHLEFEFESDRIWSKD